jgi:hypothetical protein
MARLHPHLPNQGLMTGGDYRERDLLWLLRDALPDSFDVFHGLTWSAMHGAFQQFGELDLTIVSPVGHLLVLEVKAGEVFTQAGQLLKNYGRDGTKDVGHQVRRQYGALRSRLAAAGLADVYVDTLLVLPDHAVIEGTLAYPRERIIDATQMARFCSLVQEAFSPTSLGPPDRERLIDFLSNRFGVAPNVDAHIAQVQRLSTQLSSGLATWVPRISQDNQVYVVEATAGSGKTQLALTLLRDACLQNQRARYVCFNRPLADHLQDLVPSRAEVSTFHQICRDHAERQGKVLDFSQANVFSEMVDGYIAASHDLPPTYDLLVIDESQDFDPSWVQALAAQLKPDARLYVLGDPHQQLYDRAPFDLPGAVHLRCMDNYRSPIQVVKAINQLHLVDMPINACSPHSGQTPGFHTWAPGQINHDTVLDQCLKQLWADGYTPGQVAVLSFRGVRNAEVLKLPHLGGFTTRRTSGQYDIAGNALWHEGDLLLESVYRFKGQSAPVVVLCEVDFESLSTLEARKLFVGMTRGQMRAEVVLSERTAGFLTDRL